MNAYFCSVEQLDHPELQGRPIGITNGAAGSCIITCSYEARAFGIHTGMRLREAQRLCPDFIRLPARPERYAAVSANIMDALGMITPDIEVFSVDEAFLDVSHCQRLLGPPALIARRVKQTVFDASGGILCSVGVSGDKTTAKYAAKLNKPDGMTLIPPWRAAAVLAPVPVTDLCGIARGIGRYLAERGIHTCGDMQKLPIGELGRRFGNPGRRIWLMTQGQDPEAVKRNTPPPKSIGHGKIMPPDTRERDLILTYMLHMAEKVAARLRRHGFRAGKFYIGLRERNGWLGDKYRHDPPTDHGGDIMRLGVTLVDRRWQGQGIYQIQITALDPRPAGEQLQLFAADQERRDRLNRARDTINRCYGEFAIAPARLLRRSSMPNVIAPAWKPGGHRETILNG
jgi:DNA polymerase-4